MQKHTNTYEEENYKDKLTNIIKMICIMYLEKQDSIEHIELLKLQEYFKYTELEYINLVSLKDSLKVQNYHQSYLEIYSNLDSMIMQDNLICKQEKVTFIELTKDINYLEDILGFCYGILSKIIKERNE